MRYTNSFNHISVIFDGTVYHRISATFLDRIEKTFINKLKFTTKFFMKTFLLKDSLDNLHAMRRCHHQMSFFSSSTSGDSRFEYHSCSSQHGPLKSHPETGECKHSAEYLMDQGERRKGIPIKMIPWVLKGYLLARQGSGSRHK